MNNVISRFHLDHRHQVEQNNSEWLQSHPNNATGFHTWCRNLDSASSDEDLEFFNGTIPRAPCYGEFYKYTQWHNLVPDAIELIDPPVPLLTLHYEDYAHQFNETATTLLRFLELDLKGSLREYTARTDYIDYFTEAQLQDIKSFIQSTSSNLTWVKLNHYFVNI
jgi:hypothetical protein